jgi:2-keto-4-pentenoate hydratase/2-oxohepta-3-ene-1,7-dioic acid hydratase in catechol pathway
MVAISQPLADGCHDPQNGLLRLGTHPVRNRPPTFLADGDIVEVSIEGVGTLGNPVAAES